MSYSLPSDDEYKAIMARIETLMDDKSQTRGGELDKLADQAVAYEALDEATTALIRHMTATSFVRRDPRLRGVYRKRAETVVRAWLDAIASQTKRPSTAPALTDKDT